MNLARSCRGNPFLQTPQFNKSFSGLVDPKTTFGYYCYLTCNYQYLQSEVCRGCEAEGGLTELTAFHSFF